MYKENIYTYRAARWHLCRECSCHPDHQ